MLAPKPALFAAALCLVAAPAVAQTTADRPALITQARAKMDARAWAEADTLYTQAITLDSHDPEAWVMRGFARAVGGNPDDAVADNSAALVAATLAGDARSKVVAYTNRADVWNRRREPLRALLDSAAACKISEGYAPAWLARADAQYLLGDFAQAQAALARARALQPTATRPYTEAGAKANTQGRQPINDGVDTAGAFIAAVEAAQKGEWQQAVKAYGLITEVRPASGDAWGNRGVLNYQAERDTEAVADYSTAITVYELTGDTTGQGRNLVNRAGAFLRLGRLREAAGDLEFAAKLAPGDTRTGGLLAYVRKKIAETPAAQQEFLARAKSLVQQARVINRTRDLFDKNPANEALLALLDKTLKAEPTNAQAWYLRGIAEEISFTMLGGNLKAVPFYDKAIALDPALADAYRHRGDVLLNQFSIPAASRVKGWADRDRAIELGVNDARLWADRADERQIIHSDYDGALADIDRALVLEPKNPRYLKLREEILKRKAK